MPLLVWPLPALLTWAGAWAAHQVLLQAGTPLAAALLLATALGGALSVWGSTRWRRLFIAAGFPLSLLVSGAAGAVSPWVWLLPLALLLLLYPLNTWRDAPLFPTPARALDGLGTLLPLPPAARIVDAGSGLGAGLIALRSAYPAARIEGLEWSWLLVLASRLRCPFAKVSRADIWAADWSEHDLVYLFQRPESMPRAWEKARREMRAGSWLVSLEFQVPGVDHVAWLDSVAGKPVWVYRVPLRGKPPASVR